MRSYYRREDGSMLGMAVIVMLVFTVITTAMLALAGTQYSVARGSLPRANALLVAEAGIETAVYELNQDDEYGGTLPAGEVLFNDPIQGRGVFVSDVQEMDDSNARTIISRGTVYRYGTNTEVASRGIRTIVVGTGSNGYSVATGPGGLTLGGSASITNSDVYVNGTLTLGGSSKIGTNAYPVNVNVANIACPTGNNPGATYPALCSSGQPISLANSTNIYGTVCATGQTSTGPNNNIKPGVGGEGLKVGCTAPPVSPPSYDRPAHIAAVTSTYASNSSTAKCDTWLNPGGHVRNWPANMKITGNVEVASDCEVTINGNVYITGDFKTGGSGDIRVADGLTTPPVILVDGAVEIGGSSAIITNSAGVGAKIVSFKGSGVCNLAMTCSGTPLKTSQGMTTVDIKGGVNMPGIVFQAYWGKLVLAGSGNIGAAAGQMIDMSGGGTVTFGTELSSGEKSWTISSYQRLRE